MPAKKIIVEIDLPVEKALIELAYIMQNLRRSQNYFKEHYGYVNRQAQKYWEDKADAWIKQHIKL